MEEKRTCKEAATEQEEANTGSKFPQQSIDVILAPSHFSTELYHLILLGCFSHGFQARDSSCDDLLSF